MAGTCEDLTIEENMALAQLRGDRRGYSRAVKASMREGFRERLATLGLGLENRLADRIGLLSGGQRQAVSLLMAALRRRASCCWTSTPPRSIRAPPISCCS